MKKIIFTILTLISFLSFQPAQAECAIVGINASGQTVTISISCEFPVYVDTGNPQEDAAQYGTDKDAWIAAHPDDYNAIASLSDAYYEIHQADFNAMPAAKQAVITAHPDQYHIIP